MAAYCPKCGQDREQDYYHSHKKYLCKTCNLLFGTPNCERVKNKTCRLCDSKVLYIKEEGWDRPSICDSCVKFILNRNFDRCKEIDVVFPEDGD